MRYASVCSGVEAASLAWMPLGWEAVWFSEIEPFPCAVLKERFPGVPNLGDMTKIEGEKYHGTVDLLVGGTPCQGFSVAGKQGGLNDSRSALCLAYSRLLETMRPRWFVWENVPGVFSTNQGNDFRAFLGKIDEIGYSVAWRVLDAQYVRVDGFPRAVPQRRRRVFVVGHLGGDWRYPASVLFEPSCLPGDTPPRRVKGAGVARSLTASTGGASGKEQQHTFISGDGRPLNALGVDGLVMDAEFWNGEDVSTTLTEAFADDRMPDKGKLPCVICRSSDMANAETRLEVGTTLLARQYKSPPFVCAGFSGGQGEKAGTGGGNLPILQEIHRERETTIAFRWAASPSQGLPIGIDYCHTMMANKNGGPAVCYTNARTVRRLTPRECERLMGFPEVDVLEIGKMTKDEFIAWELASGNITVDFSTGKVFSCRTGGGTPCPPHELEGTILSGYKVVSLREKEVKKQCRVHRILWIAAHGIIPDGYVIDHINNDKLDNRLCNLQLLRPEENSTKAAKDGLYLTGEDHPKTKLTDEQKNDIITLYETEYYSVRRLAAMYGVSKSRIHQLVKRQGWTQIPWKGKPADECPDSPRYKACGNSMCVNVMRWIGMRIENVERRMKGAKHDQQEI